MVELYERGGVNLKLISPYPFILANPALSWHLDCNSAKHVITDIFGLLCVGWLVFGRFGGLTCDFWAVFEKNNCKDKKWKEIVRPPSE
jgi:hypothetical protein